MTKSSVKRLVIKMNGERSDIYCGSGAFDMRMPKGCTLYGNMFVITDTNVYGLYSGLIKERFDNSPLYVIKAGEGSKNYKELFNILSAMLSAGVTRSYTVVALGGGVVGDIAGLAASLYMRGVKLVQIPTTLLSQVDSSVGGKTAVDLNGVKNAVGAFYQPQTVIIDPMFLNTLPKREIRCGLGEIIKYGALNSAVYEVLLKNSGKLFTPDFREEITYPCVCHKAEVVKADEKDVSGIRKTLNLGHTTGHAFELYYKRKSHGEFVLIGMYYELYIAEKLGVCEGDYAQSLKSLIKKVIGKIPAYADAEAAAQCAKFDKKNTTTQTVSLIVPHRKGESAEVKLPVEEYSAYIKECAEAIKEGKY